MKVCRFIHGMTWDESARLPWWQWNVIVQEIAAAERQQRRDQGGE